jgi:hypothetical protein
MAVNTDAIQVSFSDIITPPTAHFSGEISPTINGANGFQPCVNGVASCHKKKKKRKSPKSPKIKETLPAPTNPSDSNGRPPVLCISRNKHWRYISSYHVRVFCVFLLTYWLKHHPGSLAPAPSRASGVIVGPKLGPCNGCSF